MMADNLNSDRLNRQMEILKKMNAIKDEADRLERQMLEMQAQVATMDARLRKLRNEYSSLDIQLTQLLEEAFAA
jgi:hypothetical protein